MPGRRKKHFKNNLKRANVKETYTVGNLTPLEESTSSTVESKHASELSKETRLAEQQKHGIYYEDDYDYLQHLKDVSDLGDSEAKEQLIIFDPESGGNTSAFCEEEIEDVDAAEEVPLPDSLHGMLAESDAEMFTTDSTAIASEMVWDPDVAAALDDSFDFDNPDNELEDDFMALADEKAGHADGEEILARDFKNAMKFGDDIASSDVDSDVVEATDDDDDWIDEEEDEDINCTKHSSSVLPRNSRLQLLDAHTETVMQREYTEDQIGALDCEELNGRVTFDSDLFRQTVKELKDSRVNTLKDIIDSPDRIRPVIPESWKYVEEKDGSSNEEDDDKQERQHEMMWSAKKPQWDCVSILSTLSRTKNIPKTIVWPSQGTDKKKKELGVAADPCETGSQHMHGLTLKELEQQRRAERLADAPLTFRPTGETADEKRARKNAVKQYRQERRAEKKVNKEAFSKEMHHQTKLLQVRQTQERVVSLQVPN